MLRTNCPRTQTCCAELRRLARLANSPRANLIRSENADGRTWQAARCPTIALNMTLRSLVTGGAGFIGSHLCEALIARGDDVVAFDDLSTGVATNVAALAGNARFRLQIGDILDAPAIHEAVRGCDRVYHFAAAVGVKLVMEQPISTILTNTRGTENVLAACAEHATRTLIASSSEVYGKMGSGQSHPLAESDDWRLGATATRRWSYACTKALDEFLALAYHDQRALPVVIARLFNTVGPRQRANYGMVIPNFMQAARAGRPIVVHGDGTQSRCFNHVADTVDAIVRLMETPAAIGEVVNVGSDQEITMNDLAARIVALCASKSPITHLPYGEVYGRGFEDMARRTPDLSKVQRMLGQVATRTVDETLSLLVHE